MAQREQVEKEQRQAAVVLEVDQQVVVQQAAVAQDLQEGPGFQAFQVVLLVPFCLFVLFQWFVKHCLRKGVCVESKGLIRFSELVLLLRLTPTNTELLGQAYQLSIGMSHE